jgi:competence protein ComEC
MGGRTAVGAAIALWIGLLIAGATHGASMNVGGFVMHAAIMLPLFALAAAWALSLVALRGSNSLAASALWLGLAFAGLARGDAHAMRLRIERAPLLGSHVVRVAGAIVAPPALESGAPVAVVSVRAARPALSRDCRLRVRLPEGCAAEWGDEVTMIAQLGAPEAERNPGGFDARGPADAMSLAGTGTARFAELHGGRGFAALPRASVMRWRRAIENRLHARLSSEAAELVAPLVFGDRTAVDSELDASFRAAGLMHLLALSGLHVVWLASLARGLAILCGAGVRGRAIARGGCALLYLLLAGPIPSLARAACSEMLSAGSRLAQRALDPIQALAVSAALLLAMCPGWARDLGFQLSCVATLGLITIGAALSSLHAGDRLADRCASYALRACGPTAGAQLMSAPLLLSQFHALAWTSLFTNLVAVPVTGLLLASAWAGALLDLAWPGLGVPLLHACEPLARVLRVIVEGAWHTPGALIATGHGAATALAAIGACLLAASLARERIVLDPGTPAWRDALMWVGVALSAAALLLALGARPMRPLPGHAWVVVLDVGQGDAIALALDHAWWLVDTGPRTPRFDSGQSIVLPFLRWAGVRRLDRLLLTHDDGDHTGGARAVIVGARVREILAPARREGLPGPLARFGGTPLARGDVLSDVPGIRVLWPPPADSLKDYWEHPLTSADNGAALVLEIACGPTRALLTADADSAVERALSVPAGVALLKVAHHGSASSSGALFLKRAAPRFAAISVGRFNRFGHPDARALERLEAFSGRVVRTDVEGALWFDLSADGIERLDWRGGEVDSRERLASRGAGGECARSHLPSP